MLGAITGDIAGSRFEFSNYKAKDFDLYAPGAFFTDDTVMTIAVAKAVLSCRGDYGGLGRAAVKYMREFGARYPDAGYGGRFLGWLLADKPQPPYGSYGNGAAMRISPVGWAARSLPECLEMARLVTGVTHDHPDSFAAAECVAACIFLARGGADKAELRRYVETHYRTLDFTIDGLRPTYGFSSSCRDSVPPALEAFFESDCFEDAVRTAVSLGGDSDTIAAIAGSIAEPYYGIPEPLRVYARSRLPGDLLCVLDEFEETFGK